MTAVARAVPATFGLTLRLHRFEVVALLVFGALTATLAFLVAGRLDALRFDPACIDPTGMSAPSAACERAMNEFYAAVNSEAGKVGMILPVLPFLAALLLGVPVVGRELERGTTRLAWALAPSRLRWFVDRLVPVLLLVAGASLVLGVAADRLLAAAAPEVDVANSFASFGSRGVVLAARAVFVFALAVHVGAAMGRALPAMIVAGLLAFVGLMGGDYAHQEMLRAEAVEMEQVGPNDLWADQRFRLPDGRLIGWEELEQHDPMPTDPNFTGEWPTLPMVQFGVPGTRYGEVALREVGVLVGGSLVALVATALIVQRRRPG
jgi:hypothetical protein